MIQNPAFSIIMLYPLQHITFFFSYWEPEGCKMAVIDPSIIFVYKQKRVGVGKNRSHHSPFSSGICLFYQERKKPPQSPFHTSLLRTWLHGRSYWRLRKLLSAFLASVVGGKRGGKVFGCGSWVGPHTIICPT